MPRSFKQSGTYHNTSSEVEHITML